VDLGFCDKQKFLEGLLRGEYTFDDPRIVDIKGVSEFVFEEPFRSITSQYLIKKYKVPPLFKGGTHRKRYFWRLDIMEAFEKHKQEQRKVLLISNGETNNG